MRTKSIFTLLVSASLLTSLLSGCAPQIKNITLCNSSGSPYGGGSGTSSSPYLICSAAQLNAIVSNPSSVFSLASPVDLSTAGSIFLSTFTGTFSTNGYSITGGLFIYPGSTQPMYFYTASYSNSVNQDTYSLNGGQIAALSPSSVASFGASINLSISKNLKWLYTADQTTASGVSEYSINSSTGALTNIGNLSLSDPQNVWVHPSSKWVYVSNWSDDSIYQYSINQTTGVLTPLSPAKVVGPTNEQFVAVEPTGNYAYEVNNGGGSISQYAVDQTAGTLSSLSPATVSSGTYVAFIGFDPTGKYLYALDNSSNRVYQYSIQTGGTLSALTPAYVSLGASSPRSMSFATIASGTYAYVSTSANTIAEYSISSGLLTSIGTTTAVPGAGFSGILTDPSTQWIFVAQNSSNAIAQFTIQSNGTLSLLTATAASTQSSPRAMAIYF